MKVNNNQQAHEILNTFHAICDQYNVTGLTKLSLADIVDMQQCVNSAYTLFQFLKEKEPDNKAIKSYLMFCGKLFLRLSYLREYGRKETLQEASNYWEGFNQAQKG